MFRIRKEKIPIRVVFFQKKMIYQIEEMIVEVVDMIVPMTARVEQRTKYYRQIRLYVAKH